MRIKWQNWVWLPVAVLGGAASVILTLPQIEPITGFDRQEPWENPGLFAFVAFCFGGGTFLVFKNRWYWKFLAALLLLSGLVFSVPLPSMAGMRIHLTNENESEINVTVSRAKQPARFVRQTLPSHNEIIYHTAPGEYPEGMEIKIQSGGNSLETSIIELRHNRVVFSPSGIALQPFSK